jgi:prevent-host-death family protein
MKSMGAAEFKARCLKVMDDVHRRGESVLITKKGKPVARLMPVERQHAEDIFGCLRGIVRISGDIEAPAVPVSEWEQAR